MPQTQGASTFSKGLHVLTLFADAPHGLSMAEVAKRTGFDRATARRLCLALEESGYVERQNGALQLSPKIVALTGGYLTSHGIGRSVQPVLNQFAEVLQGEIALVVREGMRGIYVARSAVASARMSFGFSVGSSLPLLPTAVGRMLLAQCDQATRESLINESPVGRHTPQTETDRAHIAQAVEEAMRQGYAYVEGEFECGIAGFAVPTGPIGGAEAVLATNLSVASPDMPDRRAQVLDALRSAAMQLRA